jgi:chorismate dehydratase
MYKLAVGQICYVNSYPLFYTIIKERDSLPFDVVTEVPAVLNGMMRRGELDVSLISSFEYTQAQDRYLVHRDFCLASVGYVNSVLLVYKKEIDDLNGAVIGLSPASGTSSNLIRIILKEFYGFANEYRPVAEPAGCGGSLTAHDAVLMIGDDALRFDGRENCRVYDIGKLWTEKTGLPVVFAIIAVNAFSAGEKKDLLSLFFQKLKQSHALFESHPEQIAAYAQSRSTLALNFADYYSHLTYQFTRELEEGLLYYYRMLAKHRLAPPVKGIRYYDEKA